MLYRGAVEIEGPGVRRQRLEQRDAMLVGHLFKAFDLRPVSPDDDNHHAPITPVGEESLLIGRCEDFARLKYLLELAEQSPSAVYFFVCRKCRVRREDRSHHNCKNRPAHNILLTI